jgi:hypothetical protein
VARFKREALIFSCFLLAASLVTFPVIFYLRSRVSGLLGLENLAQTLWFQWLWESYLKTLPQAGGVKAVLLFFTFPVNVPMANFFDLIPSALIKFALGFPAYYNVKVILVLALNGYTMAVLLRYYFPDFKLSWLFAFPFAFNPYIIFNLATGRMTESMLFWLPLFLLYYFKTLQDRSPRAPYLAGLMLALAALTYWYYAYFLVFLALGYLVFYYGQKPRHFWRTYKGDFAKLVGIFWLVVFFFATPYLAMVGRGESLPGAVLTHNAGQSQAAAVLEQLINDSYAASYPFSGERGFPLILSLGAVLALFLKKKEVRFWLIMAGLFYLFSLGPYVKLGAQPLMIMQHRILLPYALIVNLIPGLNRLFWPSQYVIMVILALCLLWGEVAQSWSKGIKVSKRVALVLWAWVPIFALELWARGFLTLPSTPLVIPDFYKHLEAGVIEIPIKKPEGVHHYFDLDLKLVNFYQSCHGQKVLWGQAPPRSESDYTFKHPSLIEENTFFLYLQHISAGEEGFFTSADLAAFLSAGYRYLVVHERFATHGTLGFEVDKHLGEQRFAFMVKALSQHFGEPQFAWETLRELPRQARGSYFPLEAAYLQTYRVAIFHL